MNRLFRFLSRFNRREQSMLLLGGLAVALWLLWVALLAPLQERRDNAELAREAATETLSRVQMLAARIRDYREREDDGTGDSASMARIIDDSLSANDLSMSGLQPGTAGEVRVRLDQVPYARLVAWLHDLEYRHDLAVRDLSVAATNEPGMVNVTVRLQQ